MEILASKKPTGVFIRNVIDHYIKLGPKSQIKSSTLGLYASANNEEYFLGQIEGGKIKSICGLGPLKESNKYKIEKAKTQITAHIRATSRKGSVPAPEIKFTQNVVVEGISPAKDVRPNMDVSSSYTYERYMRKQKFVKAYDKIRKAKVAATDAAKASAVSAQAMANSALTYANAAKEMNDERRVTEDAEGFIKEKSNESKTIVYLEGYFIHSKSTSTIDESDDALKLHCNVASNSLALEAIIEMQKLGYVKGFKVVERSVYNQIDQVKSMFPTTTARFSDQYADVFGHADKNTSDQAASEILASLEALNSEIISAEKGCSSPRPFNKSKSYIGKAVELLNEQIRTGAGDDQVFYAVVGVLQKLDTRLNNIFRLADHTQCTIYFSQTKTLENMINTKVGRNKITDFNKLLNTTVSYPCGYRYLPLLNDSKLLLCVAKDDSGTYREATLNGETGAAEDSSGGVIRANLIKDELAGHVGDDKCANGNVDPAGSHRRTTPWRGTGASSNQDQGINEPLWV